MSLIAQSLLEIFSSWATRDRDRPDFLEHEDAGAEPREKSESSVASHLAFHRLYAGLQSQFPEHPLAVVAAQALQLRHLSIFVRLTDQRCTLREALGAYLQMYRTVVDPKEASLERDEENGTDSIVIDWWDNPDIDESLEFRLVFGIGVTLQMIRALVGDADLEAQALYLTCPENDRFLDDYQAFFGGPVKLGSSRNRLVFPSEVLDRPIVHRSSAPMPALNDIAAHQLDRFERAYCRVNDLVDKVRDYVREHLGASAVDQKTAARDMAMSPRTLHRKLQESDRSFRDLTDEVRAQKARELLADPDYTIQQVAHDLGYSQPSSFHRAFKRWTGQTPGQARRDLLGESC
jgi:AraC-like DNA-binding protein